jgi:hypothetical protein
MRCDSCPTYLLPYIDDFLPWVFIFVVLGIFLGLIYWGATTIGVRRLLRSAGYRRDRK